MLLWWEPEPCRGKTSTREGCSVRRPRSPAEINEGDRYRSRLRPNAASFRSLSPSRVRYAAGFLTFSPQSGRDRTAPCRHDALTAARATGRPFSAAALSNVWQTLSGAGEGTCRSSGRAAAGGRHPPAHLPGHLVGVRRVGCGPDLPQDPFGRAHLSPRAKYGNGRCGYQSS